MAALRSGHKITVDKKAGLRLYSIEGVGTVGTEDVNELLAEGWITLKDGKFELKEAW